MRCGTLVGTAMGGMTSFANAVEALETSGEQGGALERRWRVAKEGEVQDGVNENQNLSALGRAATCWVEGGGEHGGTVNMSAGFQRAFSGAFVGATTYKGGTWQDAPRGLLPEEREGGRSTCWGRSGGKAK